VHEENLLNWGVSKRVLRVLAKTTTHAGMVTAEKEKVISE
jgi:hypothetical protein